MSITDAVAKVIVSFKGDTTDLKEKIRDLQGEERKLAEEALKAAEARNASLEKWNEGLGKARDYLGKFGDAVRAAFQGIEGYVERQRLTIAAGGVSVDKLRTATAGLVKETDLLRFAAQARSGALKADTALIEDALRATRALTQQGQEHEKATNAITEALVKGEGEALKQVGIILRATKTDAERYAAIKEKIVELSAKAKEGHQNEGEAAQAASVRFSDAMDKAKEALGRLAIALTPIIEKISVLVEKASGLVDIVKGGITGDSVGQLIIEADKFSRLTPGPNESALSMLRQTSAGYLESDADIAARYKYLDEDKPLSAWDKEWQERMRRRAQLRGAIGGIGYERSIGSTPYTPSFGTSAIRLDEYDRPIDEGAWLSQMIRGNNSDRLTEDWNARMAALRGDDTGAGSGIRSAQKSQLEKIFGPLSEFDAYAKGFQLLTGAAQSAFAAWIDGSMSAGEAVRKFFADSLKGMATDLLGKAIVHGAYAIGSLAFGDFRGAATHGTAAAKAAAGAAALGILAKGIGGSGAGATAGGAGDGATGGGSTANARPVGEHRVYIVGDAFAEDSPRRRAANARRQVERVVGRTGVEFR